MLCAMRAQRKTAEASPVEDYWKVRMERAIAASLLHMGASLALLHESLRLRRERLRIHAASLDKSDTGRVRHLGMHAAEYYRAHGRQLQRARRLGECIDRHSANVARPA
jgi:hypothetical protein